MAISYIGASNLIATNGSAPGAITPNANTQVGDLLLFFHYGRATGGNETVSAPAGQGWTQVFQSVTANNGHLAVFWKIRQVGDGSSTFTVSNYTSGNSGETILEWIETYRGHNTSNPISSFTATLSTWASSLNLGPVAVPSSPTVAPGDAVIVFAGRFENVTGQTTLTGDNLTWGQNVRNDTTQGLDAGAVTQRGINNTSVNQTVTAKTITSTGTAQAGAGRMITLRSSIPVPVPTQLGQLTITGNSPTILVSNNVNLSPDTGNITVSGFSSSISVPNPIVITGNVGNLSLSAFSPTITASNNILLQSGLGQLSVQGFDSQVVATEDKFVTTDVGQSLITGFSPALQLEIIPGTGNLNLDGYSPDVENDVFLNTFLGEIVVDGYFPDVIVSNNIQPAVQTGELTIEGQVPIVLLPVNVPTDDGHLQINGSSPTLKYDINVPLSEMVADGYSPDAALSDNIFINPDVAELIFDGHSPSIEFGTIITGSEGNLLILGLEPVVSVSKNIVIETLSGDVVIEGKECLVTISENLSLNCNTGQVVVTSWLPTITITGEQPPQPGYIPGVSSGGIGGGTGVVAGTIMMKGPDDRYRDDEEIFAIIQSFIKCLK